MLHNVTDYKFFKNYGYNDFSNISLILKKYAQNPEKRGKRALGGERSRPCSVSQNTLKRQVNAVTAMWLEDG